jgi:hypothetical protein
VTLTARTQNLFDTTNTLKYAHFLFSTHDYDLAAEEYNRLLFMVNDKSDSLKWMLIRSNRLAGKSEKAFSLFSTYYKDTVLKTDFLSKEFLSVNFGRKDFLMINKMIPRLTLDTSEIVFYTISNEILMHKYNSANLLLSKHPTEPLIEPYKDVLVTAHNLNFKSPVLAGALSAVIPGLGQTYSGNLKDGIFAFILTGSATYQAYRGFQKYGVESLYGWIFSAIATAFYSSNIYGAIKAANKKNYLNHLKISFQVETILHNYYN